MPDLGLVLNPTDDGYPAELDIAEGTAYVCVGADFPPPAPKPAYASSYDTEGSVATDEAHYENREIKVQLVVYGTSAADLEAKLNALYKMLGQVNREGGSLGLTTVAGTVCFFDLVPEAAAVTQFNLLYAISNAAEVELALQARPFWRGVEQLVSDYATV